MASSPCVCILRCILVFSMIIQCKAVITVPPVSVTVPPFTTATFTCEGTGDILNWWIQSAPLTDSIAQQREITVTTTNTSNINYSSVLTVKALPNNDGLGIGCEVISYNLSNPSNPFNRVISSSNLTIRGVSPVKDLIYSFTSNNALLITWSPPVYYSNDIPVGSSVSYQVLVTDDEGDIILDTNTPDTNIEVANVTECDTFNISVTVILAQYTSVNKTNSNNGSLTLGYNATITTNKNNFLTPNVSIELSCPPSKCNSSLTITSGSEVIDQYIFTGTDGVVNDIHTLVPSNEYNYTVRVFNLRNTLEYETYTIITTYQVICLYISNTYTNGSVSVQCVYELVSTADGCHVIFTDTINGTVLNVSLPLVQGRTPVTLPAGNYTVTVYDNINGSLYGPAVYYPTLVEVIKVIPSSTSSSIINESISPTVSNDVTILSTTITVTFGTETETSSTSGPINDNNNYIVPIVASTVSVIVLVILIILTVCVSIIVNKRKRMNVQVLIRPGNANIQQPQAATNQNQDIFELINELNEVPITTSSVQLTNNRPIDDENPYNVTMSEFLHDNHTIPSHEVEGQLMPQHPHPSLTSTTTQETNIEDSISSATSNNIHDNEYTTNDNITLTVNDTATVTNNGTTTAATDTTVTNTATAAPTYAVIAKRTDAIVQHVVYNKVTGDINKRGGGVTVYATDDISAIPPPPSYADTVAQEHSATVSSSQFKVTVQVTDAAVVHGQYENHPPTNTGDEYGINTPVQDQSNSTDAVHVHVWSGEPPMYGEKISPIQFQETGENMSIEKSPLVDSSFEGAERVDNHIDDHISDEMVGVKPCPVVLKCKEEPGALVPGFIFISKTEGITTSHEVMKSENEYQTQKVFEDNSTSHEVKTNENEYLTQKIFEDNSDHENHKVPEVIPSTRNKVNLMIKN